LGNEDELGLGSDAFRSLDEVATDRLRRFFTHKYGNVEDLGGEESTRLLAEDQESRCAHLSCQQA
jgi:hypothetical protein